MAQRGLELKNLMVVESFSPPSLTPTAEERKHIRTAAANFYNRSKKQQQVSAFALSKKDPSR